MISALRSLAIPAIGLFSLGSVYVLSPSSTASNEPQVYKTETLINYKDSFGEAHTGYAYGSAFNYKGHLVTAGHICTGAANGQIGIINPETRELVSVRVLQNYPKDDVCVLESVKFSHRDLARASIPLDADVISEGYAHGTTFTKAPLHYQTSSHVYIQELGPVYEDIYFGLIIPGMSGGPVVDKLNRLVGLNSAGDQATMALIVPISIIDRDVALTDKLAN